MAGRISRPPAVALAGALFSVVLAFPAAIALAIVYRFPVPFSGYESGWAAVPLVVMAVAFYGALGGFVVLAVAGALAGIRAERIAQRRGANPFALALAFAAAIAFVAAFCLAILDKVIGPW